MPENIRAYNPDTDFDAVARIWLEVGWIEDSDEHKTALKGFLGGGDVEVGLVADAPECAVQRMPGTLRHSDVSLPMSAIGAVTTSLVGRKLGFASRMTARAIKAGTEQGAALSTLGIFDQGFYDRFGFATGSYDHRVSFDPQTLQLDGVAYRTPERLGPDNAAEVQAALAARPMHHGAVVLHSVDVVRAEMTWPDNPVALGYRNGQGTLTHFFLGDLKDEHGPLRINAMAYRDVNQLLELFRLMRELGDQIRSVDVFEPRELQLQSLLEAPFRHRQRTRHTAFEAKNEALAWWQLRINDVATCVAAHEWLGEPVRFNLTLTDPVSQFLEDDWRGAGGNYTITVGAPSAATNGHDPSLETLECGVGAFTQLWFGIAPATTLRAIQGLRASNALCAQLDRALVLPPTTPGWEY